MGAIVTEIKGKLGGQVFQRLNKSLGIRNNPHHSPSNQLPSSRSRNQFAQIANAWNQLTESQRNSWILSANSYPAYDGFGNAFNLSGYQLFVKANRYKLLIGQSIIQSGTVYNPPPRSNVDDDGLFLGSSTWTVFFENPIEAGTVLIFFATNPYPPGTSANNAKYHYAFHLNAGSLSPNNRFAVLNAAMRTPLYVGAQVGYRVIKLHLSTGNFVDDGGVWMSVQS